jgi:hypothetical protein
MYHISTILQIYYWIGEIIAVNRILTDEVVCCEIT